ncbi:MAG: hypothetical protein HY696_02215 [Deltaproteobacteria bacterium]|nr:hypothetical protein [Deltaproteobacteria bacterium]
MRAQRGQLLYLPHILDMPGPSRLPARIAVGQRRSLEVNTRTFLNAARPDPKRGTVQLAIPRAVDPADRFAYRLDVGTVETAQAHLVKNALVAANASARYFLVADVVEACCANELPPAAVLPLLSEAGQLWSAQGVSRMLPLPATGGEWTFEMYRAAIAQRELSMVEFPNGHRIAAVPAVTVLQAQDGRHVIFDDHDPARLTIDAGYSGPRGMAALAVTVLDDAIIRTHHYQFGFEGPLQGPAFQSLRRRLDVTAPSIAALARAVAERIVTSGQYADIGTLDDLPNPATSAPRQGQIARGPLQVLWGQPATDYGTLTVLLGNPDPANGTLLMPLRDSLFELLWQPVLAGNLT